MKEYEATMVLFKEDLRAYPIEIEGSRTKVIEALNNLLKQNSGFDNIQIVLRGKK